MIPSEAPERGWKEEIARRLEQGDGLEFTLEQFAQAVGTAAEDEALREFLNQAIGSGALKKIVAYRCPMPECKKVLSPAGAPYSGCPYCLTDYLNEGVEVATETFYKLAGETSRDIRWMIVVHGMNSRAEWQEEFSWQIANKLRYSYTNTAGRQSMCWFPGSTASWRNASASECALQSHRQKQAGVLSAPTSLPTASVPICCRWY